MSSDFVRACRRRLSRRSLRTLGWFVGAPLAVFRFLRRELPIEDLPLAAGPPTLPVEQPDPAHREDHHAHGPVVHRLYSTSIDGAKLDPERLLAIIAADPNVIAPREVLRFEKSRGTADLSEGDALLVRMAGPWNAPVEVTRRWRTGFRLAATKDNPQLGQVEIRVRDEAAGIVMEIQTRERAAGVGFLLLRRIGLVRRMQLHLWAEMLENAAQLAGGRRPERITVRSWHEQAPAV